MSVYVSVCSGRVNYSRPFPGPRRERRRRGTMHLWPCWDRMKPRNFFFLAPHHPKSLMRALNTTISLFFVPPFLTQCESRRIFILCAGGRFAVIMATHSFIHSFSRVHSNPVIKNPDKLNPHLQPILRPEKVPFHYESQYSKVSI